MAGGWKSRVERALGALSKLLGGLRQDIAATSVDLVAQNLLIEIAATMQRHLMAVESGR